MSAAQYDFNIEQGSSFKLSLVYRDSNRNIIDLTGWCARLIWKTSQNVTQSFHSNNTSQNLYRFTLDGPNGKLTLVLPASTTNNFSFTTAKYDLELQSPTEIFNGGGKYTIRILYGTATLIKRNSRSSAPLECQDE